MGGVCSVRRNGERSGEVLGEEGMTPSYFDRAWDEGYAPTATVNGNAGGPVGGRAARVGRDGPSGCKWPALAEEHLTRLYNNDECYCVRQDGSHEPLSLVDLCVRSMCKRLAEIGEFPATLPREIVDALLASLTQHRALSCHALEAFRECEVTSLSLGGCRGVRNGWVKHLLADTRCGQFIVNLDLTNCAGLTDTGLSNLPTLHNLKSATLRHCHGLGAEATLFLSNSPRLEYLSLAHCPRLDDIAVGNLVGLPHLKSLDIEGCEGVGDEGLRLACELPSITCLNASRCHAITVEGLHGLYQAADRLKLLNLGWCKGLARRVGSDDDSALGPTDGGRRVSDDEEQEEHEGDDEDSEGEGGGEEDPQEALAVAGGMQEVGEGGAIGSSGEELREGEAPVGVRGEQRQAAMGPPRRHRRRRRRRPRQPNNRRRQWELPPLPKLERLCLARSGIADIGLSWLAAGSPLLKELELSGCLQLTANSASMLSALADQLQAVEFSYCRHLRSVTPGLGKSLRTLSLAGTAVREVDVCRMSRELTNLTSLNLDSCDVGDFGLMTLSHLTTLERLNLADTGLSDTGMVFLSRLTRLRDLSLFFCPITDTGLAPLASLTGLTRLNLDTKDVGDTGIQQLTGLRRLETLDVFSAAITDLGVAHVLCRLPSLKGLEVCSGRLTDRALHHLSRVKTLTRLNVSQNMSITPAGVRHIGTLTGLRSLNLSCCNVTPGSLDSLTGLVNLESLAVFGCRLARADLEPLRGKLPNLRVVRA